MLIPLSWLKEYVDIKMPFPELATKLSAAGLMVESWKEVDGDIIFDPEVTPNRPDWMSVYGIAREIATITNTKLKKESFLKRIILKKNHSFKEESQITIKPNYKLIPRMTSVVIKNVKVKPSPDWLAKRIKQINLRPINNLVDITNYVLWIYGNPLHVFDYDKIRGHQLIVDTTKGGEHFRSLDGLEYTLPANATVIKDVGRIIDLPPIKGGENSAVENNSKNILLHSIVCDPVMTRRTSQALFLRSDSSAISERGIDPNGTIPAVELALKLILELASGEVASEIIDHKEKEFKPWTVELPHAKLESVLGIEIDPKRVIDILEKLGLTVDSKQGATLYRVVIPTFRNDIHAEEDLIEEVARIYGYNKFPKTLPASPVPTTEVAYHRNFDFEYNIKQILKGAGYNEIYTYSLISEDQLTKLGIDPGKTLRIDNPISKEFEYLRPNLIGNLLGAVKLNLPNFSDIKLYELGKVYKGASIDKFEEQYWLSAVISGDKFYETKGAVENLLTQLGIDYQIVPPTNNPTGWSHPGRTADILFGEHNLGAVGELHPSLLSHFGIKSRAIGWYLNYTLLEKLAKPERIYQAISKYPPIVEDISLIIPDKVLYTDVVDTIQLSSKLVSTIQLLDTHQGTKTLRVTYLDPNKNLTDKDAAEIKTKFLKKLKELGVQEK